ncbi:MAG: hypothetical protein ABH821_00290 [archaeon]
MKKLLFLLIIMLMVSFSLTVSAKADYPILDRQVETRQASLHWTTEIQKTSMTAVIDYIKEISSETDAGKLTELFDEFNVKTETVDELNTHVGLNNLVRELIGITSDFSKERQKLMTENNGKPLVLLARIVTALNDNKTELDSLKNAFWEKNKENSLEIFDIRAERAENTLNALELLKFDVSEARDKLNEIKDKRSELESALEEQKGLEVLKVQLEIFGLSVELAQIVRDLQWQLPPKIVAGYWITVGTKVLERTSMIIEDLKLIGINVSELEAIQVKAEDNLEKARTEFDNGNYEESVEFLELLRENLEELHDAYMELIFGETVTEENLEQDLQATANSLEKTLEDMDESINTN